MALPHPRWRHRPYGLPTQGLTGHKPDTSGGNRHGTDARPGCSTGARRGPSGPRRRRCGPSVCGPGRGRAWRGRPRGDRRRDRPDSVPFGHFVLAIFVGYYVVWSVTPALHTPLMSVTNAISSVIVVGALLAVGVELVGSDSGPVWARLLGFVALAFASVNI